MRRGRRFCLPKTERKVRTVQLKGKAEKFCMEYVVDYNATKAAVRAGYSEASAANAGYRLLKNDDVLARVRELQEEFNKTRCFDEKSRVLAECWSVYDIATAAKPVMEWDREEKCYKETGEYQIDGRTAAKSLELIAKMSGMLTDKVEHKFGEGGIEVNISVADND